jgi:hypothetical protein
MAVFCSLGKAFTRNSAAALERSSLYLKLSVHLANKDLAVVALLSVQIFCRRTPALSIASRDVSVGCFEHLHLNTGSQYFPDSE